MLTTVEQLEQLRPAWMQLLAQSCSNEPMLSPTWLLAWWRTFGATGGRKLRVAAFWQSSHLVGLAPLLKRRHWYLPALPFARLEMLGSGEPESAQIYSEYLSVICERGREVDVAAGLVAALTSGVLGAWDEMIIPRMDGEAVFLKLLIEALADAGLSTECIVMESAPYIPLPATWEAYLKALPSSRRYFLKRSLRDFDKWAAGQVTYHRAGNHQELQQGKSVLVALHNGRWSADGRAGKFHSPRFQAFHETVMPALLDEGALELIWVTVRGEPIAALYNVVWNNKVYFYQSGRTTDLPDNIRPGVVIQAHAIRTAIAAGRREYDFLGGASQYKLQLALATRPLVQVRVISCPYKERLRRYSDHLVSLGRSVRNIVRARCASWRKSRG